MQPSQRHRFKILATLGFLYLFLVSIDLMGLSFAMFGREWAERILAFTDNPLRGLFIGILATSLMQSSSSTTAITVGMVAGGALNVSNAIPIIMGANIGTSATNTMVSLVHISRPLEYRNAFAASTVHDFFNLLAVIILFPLQYFTGFLEIFSEGLGRVFVHCGGLAIVSPIKVLTDPTAKLIAWAFQPFGSWQAWLSLITAVILLFVALKNLVKLLRSVVVGRTEGLFQRYVFKTAPRAFLVGLVLTVIVQSSSVTTALVVPLAAAGILVLRQIYPYTLGANVGTTVTAILASLVAGTVEPVTIAFAHLLFNACAIAVIVPWKPLRELPVRAATAMGDIAAQYRWIPVAYVLVAFYLLPLILITVTR